MKELKNIVCKSLEHDWQQHITLYRCGVDEYARKCKRCGKWENISTVWHKEDGSVDKEEWYL